MKANWARRYRRKESWWGRREPTTLPSSKWGQGRLVWGWWTHFSIRTLPRPLSLHRSSEHFRKGHCPLMALSSVLWFQAPAGKPWLCAHCLLLPARI